MMINIAIKIPYQSIFIFKLLDFKSVSFLLRKFFPSQSIKDNKDSNLRGRNFAPTFYKGSNCYKFLWIRLAILNKLLNKIIDHIVNNSS
jgi:hypothetical protein